MIVKQFYLDSLCGRRMPSLVGSWFRENFHALVYHPPAANFQRSLISQILQHGGPLYLHQHLENILMLQMNARSPYIYPKKLLQPHTAISLLENPMQVADQPEFPACGARLYFGGIGQLVYCHGHPALALSKCAGTHQILY